MLLVVREKRHWFESWLVLGKPQVTHVLTVRMFLFAGECNVTKESCVIWW
jgi:hypothetical protein